ncbi:hypothetical protein [Bizionia paragorgiae]|uniref:hypothetical protein n=1 Tax=Bizionia paragorgiae TaxID=283786 RepID=UPI003A9254C9
MQTLDEIKKNWKKEAGPVKPDTLSEQIWQEIIEQQVKKQKGISMQYFWASFTFQIIVYGFLTYTLIVYGQDILVLIPSIICFLFYIPFTIILMSKFKRMAAGIKHDKIVWDKSIQDYIKEQYFLLSSFYKFKIRYEVFLVPISAAVFVWIFFHLYMPGGVFVYPISSGLLFLFVLVACTAAILAENKRNFKKPLKRLKNLLNDISATYKSKV